MTEVEARDLCAKMLSAYQTDDETAGSEALISLLTGMAVNIARIADALSEKDST